MQSTSWQTLVLTAIVVGAVSYAGLTVLESRSGALLPVPGLMWAGLAVIAVVLLQLGRSVRRLTEGEPTRMDLLRAARVAMFAKACSLCGAAFIGYFAAQVLIAWTNISAPALQGHALSSVAAGVASLVLVAVALLVEHWCSLPPDDDGEPA
ncbi:DUF3180 domain-containing protein [Georgenia sp. H159]|uniref:DUF3180 domain-containing protein n=1 Tax=Georgenia sp. H159 TaxID=3076115 RepID=UPI002D7993CB|nr:DUF3180 domain-containing protein [Georgenia sp. H159]